MMKYNHAYTLGFEVPSDDPEGKDVTPQMFYEALLRRMNDLNVANEWHEAVGAPFDTYEY